MSYDTVVVGVGLAGLVAALRLTEQGQRVLVVARGVGATHLAPATIDVLGYVKDARVDSPSTSLPSLIASEPAHPYARVGAEQSRCLARMVLHPHRQARIFGQLRGEHAAADGDRRPEAGNARAADDCRRRPPRGGTFRVRRFQGIQGLPSRAARGQPGSRAAPRAHHRSLDRARAATEPSWRPQRTHHGRSL